MGKKDYTTENTECCKSEHINATKVSKWGRSSQIFVDNINQKHSEGRSLDILNPQFLFGKIIHRFRRLAQSIK